MYNLSVQWVGRARRVRRGRRKDRRGEERHFWGGKVGGWAEQRSRRVGGWREGIQPSRFPCHRSL